MRNTVRMATLLTAALAIAYLGKATVADDQAPAGEPASDPDAQTEKAPQTATPSEDDTTPSPRPGRGTPSPAEDPEPDLGTTFTRPQFSGLLQTWYVSGNEGTHDTFRIRRAELKAVGQVGPKVRWTLMVDPSKALSINQTTSFFGEQLVVTDVSLNQAGRILQDAYISVTPAAKIRFDVGQLKIPMGTEGLQSSSTLETVERALFASDRARGGTFGDLRDVGAVLRFMPTSQVDLAVGAFNGEGQNEVDRNDQKAIAARVALRPSHVEGLQIGVWLTRTSESEPDRPRRDRTGGELQFVRGKLTLRSEYVEGEDDGIERQGYYGLIAYKLRPKVEVVSRLDTWDPDTSQDTDAASVRQRDWVVGLNYYLMGHRAKLQLDFLNKTFSNPVVQDRHLVLINLQTSW